MNILITDKLAQEAITLLEDAGATVTFDEMDHEQLLRSIGKYDALIVRSRTKATKEIIEAGAKGDLKVIGRAGIGVDNIDIKTAADHGIKVVNSPTGATQSVAELALAHMLSLSRHLTKADATMKQGTWAKKQLKGTELYEKTLGLIGSGNIGRQTARLAQAFGMNVIAYDPFIKKEDMAKDSITKIDDLSDLIKQSDYISLHIPHIKQTHHIIDKKMLSLMKPTAYLINCARGGTVDEQALFEILKEQKIAGAALDVFEQEPPNEHPLFSLDSVSCTPHIGASTTEGQIRAGTICAEQVLKTLQGKTPECWVNKALMS